jgi:uncharacterized protein YkwD
MKSIVSIFILILLFAVQTKSVDASSDPVVARINEIRIENKLRALIQNGLLNNSATNKACDLRDRNYWSHTTPEGKKFWDFFDEVGYRFVYAGENLAKNCSEMHCIELWFDSIPHRNIMLGRNYRDIGVGRCGTYTVIHLGSK